MSAGSIDYFGRYVPVGSYTLHFINTNVVRIVYRCSKERLFILRAYKEDYDLDLNASNFTTDIYKLGYLITPDEDNANIEAIKNCEYGKVHRGDILGRSLSLGDLVVYRSGYNKMGYGIMVDNEHFYTVNNQKKRLGVVFKVTNPVRFEIEKMKELKRDYMAYQRMVVQNKMVQSERGSLYQREGSVYVYLGEYVYSCNCTGSKISKTLSLFNGLGEKHKLYLRLGLSVKKGRELYERLIADIATSKDLEEYVMTFIKYIEKGSDVGLLKCYKADLTKSILGNLVGKVNLPCFDMNYSINYNKTAINVLFDEQN